MSPGIRTTKSKERIKKRESQTGAYHLNKEPIMGERRRTTGLHQSCNIGL